MAITRGESGTETTECASVINLIIIKRWLFGSAQMHLLFSDLSIKYTNMADPFPTSI